MQYWIKFLKNGVCMSNINKQLVQYLNLLYGWEEGKSTIHCTTFCKDGISVEFKFMDLETMNYMCSGEARIAISYQNKNIFSVYHVFDLTQENFEEFSKALRQIETDQA